MRSLRSLLPLIAWLPFLAACRAYNPGFEARMNPSVLIHTDAGAELGVSTDYGVVFLGRGQRSGEVDFTAWFLDGPSLETGLIEPLGSGLYLTRAEIELPSTPLTFQLPPAGTPVLVSGRRDGQLFKYHSEVVTHEAVDGLMLRDTGPLGGLGPAQMGAGVFVQMEGKWMLLGLLSGRLELRGETGTQTFHTLAGPRSLWRLASAARDLDQPKQRPKRGDILPH